MEKVWATGGKECVDGRKQAGEEGAQSVGRPHAELLSWSLPSPLLPPSAPGCNSTIWALRPAGTSETCCYMTNARSPLFGECPGRWEAPALLMASDIVSAMAAMALVWTLAGLLPRSMMSIRKEQGGGTGP